MYFIDELISQLQNFVERFNEIYEIKPEWIKDKYYYREIIEANNGDLVINASLWENIENECKRTLLLSPTLRVKFRDNKIIKK